MAQSPGFSPRSKLGADRARGTTVLRSGGIAHMKEIVNRGATSNARYRIVRK